MDMGVHNMKLYLSSFSVLFTLLLALPQVNVFAQELVERQTPADSPDYTPSEKELARTYPGYFTLNNDSIKVTLLSVGDEPDTNYVKLQETPPKDLAGIVVTIEKIVNIASKVWDIVKDNAAAVNIDTKYATAYPEGVTSATQLAGWSRPKSYTYGFYAENLYGSVMIDCKYKFSYTYNGAYKGKGKFLTGVAVIPSKVTAGWGYKFTMTAAVPDSTIANVGTDTDPVAALQMKLNWKMATVLKVVEGTSVYYLEGTGYFEEIASPWTKKEKQAADLKSAAPLLGPSSVF
ncbi:MAG: hypothetical protein A2X32_04420 [Elusimicrobia bacterium GWC2_64_44]|nr:MAG: hypothetical protein A2X32_04420 [Elusimicrobia bacterium GWC2_64_44]